MAKRVVVVGPRSSFDVAVIARTLYAGLGLEDWSIVVVGRVPRGKTLIESRVPLRLGVERLVFADAAPSLSRDAVIVEPFGERGGGPPRTDEIVVCISSCIEPRPQRSYTPLGARDPVYEAIAAIYAMWIRGRAPRCKMPSRKPPASLTSTYVYVARKLLEAVEWYDNHILLKPSIVAHILNKAVSHWGLYIDLIDWRVEAEAYTRQVIRLEVRDSRLQSLGEARVVFDSRERLVKLEDVPLFEGAEFCLDPEHGRVCLGPSTADCIEARGLSEEEVAAGIEALGL